MAASFLTGETSVGTSPTAIGPDRDTTRVVWLTIQNVSANIITLGSSAVASGTGYDLNPGAEMSFNLESLGAINGEGIPKLYGDAGGTSTVNWLALVWS